MDFQDGYYGTFIEFEKFASLSTHTACRRTKSQIRLLRWLGSKDQKEAPSLSRRLLFHQTPEKDGSKRQPRFRQVHRRHRTGRLQKTRGGEWGKLPEDYKKLAGDCATILYGVTDVCHQMLNCVLTGSKDAFLCYVNNAPSFWVTYVVYGNFGAGAKFPGRVPNPALFTLHEFYKKKSPKKLAAPFGFDASDLARTAPVNRSEIEANVMELTGLDAPSAAMTDNALQLAQTIDATRGKLAVELLRGNINTESFARDMNAAAVQTVDAWQEMAPKDHLENPDLSKSALIDPPQKLRTDVYGQLRETMRL